MFESIRRWLRNSSRFHEHEVSVHDLASCVALLDRFLDGRLRYPLEWDDFISWAHASPTIEGTRHRIAGLEPQFFSSDPMDRLEGMRFVLAERNRVAALVNMPSRGMPEATTAHAT
jgi:hypothetical protein